MIPSRLMPVLLGAIALATPAIAHPVGAGWRAGPAHGGVTVHHGGHDTRAIAIAMASHGRADGDRFGAARGFGGARGYADPPVGYWEANYGRQDDAAIFAARYGCARPIWNAKYNRYTAPCN